jgi:uncharacterized membrane protein
MAEEVKQEEKKEKVDAKKIISTIFKVLLGIVFLLLGLAAIWSWRSDLLVVIRGSVGLFLLLASLITFAIAKE